MLSRPEDQWPRVLIADDDPELLDEFASILNCEPASPQAESASGSAGPFAVTRCPTGEAAVRAVRQACADGRPYAVVVLDAVMGPGLDGIAAGHRIRGLDPDVQIVMLTTGRDHGQMERAGNIAPVDKLICRQKPLDAWEARHMVYNLSARWHMEWRLKDSEARLRAIVEHAPAEMVGRLAGGIAHDFNNLLAIISGNAEFLRDEPIEDEDTVEAILRAADKGAELTHRLLAYSGRQNLAPSAIDMALLLEKAAASLQRTLGESIEVECAIAPDLWVALADLGQLENALLTLAVNARDAMPDGGRLIIAADNITLNAAGAAQRVEAVPGDYVVLSVRDTGCGMSQDVLAHAIEPFFTTKEVGEGSGLGLSMVDGFARQSGGHATIETAEGSGTTVSVYLPRGEGPAPAITTAAVEAPTGAGELVLVVEDDSDVRALSVRVLSSLGYQVLEAADARSALAVIEDCGRIDLLLTDVVLPGGTSGAQLARQIRARHPTGKVLFMTGHAEDLLGDFDESPCASSHLIKKPFQIRDLAQSMRQALEADPAG